MLKHTSALLSQQSGLAHGFFGRQGGVSEGIYASLNCGPGSRDVPEHVAENRHRILADMGGENLVTLYQIHSAQAVSVTTAWAQGPQADAMATNVPGLVLGILTADCAPVLLADPVTRVIGAAHAGWKGAVGGVTDSVLDKMIALGAERSHVIAAIGPCIAQANYEVGPEFRASVLAQGDDAAQFFIPSNTADHWHFDLEAYVAQRLTCAGIGHIERLKTCTYAGEDSFFSFRRTTHRAEPDYGRQLSVIMLR